MNDREFAAALRDRDAILILSHLRPDGDTLGSGAALCSALRRMGKTAYLFPNPETTARYLPYVAQFFAPANFVPACVVAVDIATPNLFPQGFSGAVDLCIDHHPSNALYAGDTLLHAEKSACGEAVLDVIELLTGSVTEQEANLLYIAVTTDTGCFQYANTNAATLRAAARLLELGADNRKISMDFFRKISRARIALVGSEVDDSEFIRLIEDTGAYVCADRFCFGSLPGRDPITLTDEDDALTQICRQYVYRGQCPRTMNMEKVYGRKQYAADIAREYHADGILYEQIKFCDPWAYERTLGSVMLREDYGFPVLSVDRPYNIRSSIGQMRTRVQAFVESIEIKKIQGGVR